MTSGRAIPSLAGERVLLRAWRGSDLAPFATLNADPLVAEFLPGPLDGAESDALAARIAQHFDRHGFGLWAVEIPGVVDFIGFVGLSIPSFTAPFTPCVEIGWRLASAYWGQGYATEAARLAAGHGFGALGLGEVVAFTVPANLRSRRLMARLGMARSPGEDFDMPSLPLGHHLRRHVLYRLSRSSRLAQAGKG